MQGIPYTSVKVSNWDITLPPEESVSVTYFGIPFRLKNVTDHACRVDLSSLEIQFDEVVEGWGNNLTAYEGEISLQLATVTNEYLKSIHYDGLIVATSNDEVENLSKLLEGLDPAELFNRLDPVETGLDIRKELGSED